MVVTVPILVFLLLPTLVVIPMALTPRNYIEFPPSGLSTQAVSRFVSDDEWLTAVATSAGVAAIAVVVALVVGTTAAIALHGQTFRGKGLITAVILVPLVVPVIVVALADYRFFLELGLVGNPIAIGLAHSVLAVPYVFLTVGASLTGLNPALVRSATSLGATPRSIFRHVYLPIIRPGLVAGALFTLALSLDEAVIALFLQGPEAVTLSVKIFTDIRYNLTPQAAVASALLVTVATALLALQGGFTLRRRGHTARLARVEDSGTDVGRAG